MANVTMEDVARKAGVTRRYVSGILNNNPTVRVSEKTRERVLAIVKELNYHQDHTALSLRTGKKYCIGIAGTSSLAEMDSPHATMMYAGAGKVAEAHDYYLMFFPLQVDIGKSVVRIAKSRMVDGLLIVLYHYHYVKFNKETLPVLREEGIPFVVMHASTTRFRCNHVGLNAKKAGDLAVRHLLERGYEDIALISADQRGFNREMRKAYERRMRDAGLAVDHIKLDDFDPYKASLGYETGRSIVKNGRVHRAYVCFSDMFANGFTRALEEAGMRIPDDVALVTMGDVYGNGRAGLPRFTSVDTRTRERGATAAELLFREIEDEPGADGANVRHIIEPELIVRSST